MNDRELRRVFDKYFFNRIKVDENYRKSYNYILGLYLGDGCIYKQPRTFGLTISCDAKYTKLIDIAKKELESVFIYNSVYLNDTHKENCVDVTLHNNFLDLIFPQIGAGKKHDRDVSLAPWQKENIEHKELALGLFHSDGSYYNSKTTSIYGKVYNRYFYSFTNVSQDINEIYKECLDSLGIEYKFYLKTPREKTINGRTIISKNIYHTVIQKKKEVDKAYKLFGYKS